MLSSEHQAQLNAARSTSTELEQTQEQPPVSSEDSAELLNSCTFVQVNNPERNKATLNHHLTSTKDVVGKVYQKSKAANCGQGTQVHLLERGIIGVNSSEKLDYNTKTDNRSIARSTAKQSDALEGTLSTNEVDKGHRKELSAQAQPLKGTAEMNNSSEQMLTEPSKAQKQTSNMTNNDETNSNREADNYSSSSNKVIQTREVLKESSNQGLLTLVETLERGSVITIQHLAHKNAVKQTDNMTKELDRAISPSIDEIDTNIQVEVQSGMNKAGGYGIEDEKHSDVLQDSGVAASKVEDDVCDMADIYDLTLDSPLPEPLVIKIDGDDEEEEDVKVVSSCTS